MENKIKNKLRKRNKKKLPQTEGKHAVKIVENKLMSS
jgi:hypothetical protein